MFIKTTKNKKGTAYYHLVESFREGGKVKQRTLMSPERVEDGKLDQLAEAIGKHSDKLTFLNMSKNIDVNLGPLLVLERMVQELAIAQCLDNIQQVHPKLEFDFGKVVFTQICSLLKFFPNHNNLRSKTFVEP